MNKQKQTIIGDALPNIPWEEKPKNCVDPVWRYSNNPIIPRDLIPSSNSIFNSAVVPYEGKFAGVFRCDSKTRRMQLHNGKSNDAISWTIENDPISFICDDPEIGNFVEGYDPRVVWIEDRYYITWCNVYHGYTIGMAYTNDFKKFYQMENAFVPFNRNGVLFPRKIKGKYIMLSRPSDSGHTSFGDIFISQSPDMIHWGCHRHVMGPTSGWQHTKIGAGPVPIETREGWLLIYHGVLTSCNGYVYSMGSALLDIDEPWKVLFRTEPYILSPHELYECVGDVPNVTFPCATLADAPTGRIAIYYGGADTVTALAFTQVDELIDFTKKNSKV
ncbi:MAG: glycoside hydrolase family 130 protein [Spirochaetes bacterium]|nr:glycoside hydrolase family 130 protein [Spirochaetota bacterium]